MRILWRWIAGSAQKKPCWSGTTLSLRTELLDSTQKGDCSDWALVIRSPAPIGGFLLWTLQPRVWLAFRGCWFRRAKWNVSEAVGLCSTARLMQIRSLRSLWWMCSNNYLLFSKLAKQLPCTVGPSLPSFRKWREVARRVCSLTRLPRRLCSEFSRSEFQSFWRSPGHRWTGAVACVRSTATRWLRPTPGNFQWKPWYEGWPRF